MKEALDGISDEEAFAEIQARAAAASKAEK